MKKFDKYLEQDVPRNPSDVKTEIIKRLHRMDAAQLMRVLWYIDRKLD